MRKKILLTLLLFVSCILASCSFNNSNSSNNNNNQNNNSDIEYIGTADVIVLAGQSNMEGHSWCEKLKVKGDPNMLEYYINGFPDTQIMFNSDRGKHKSICFESVKLGQGYRYDRFGPEVGIAEEWHNRNTGKTLYIIKFAVGGTNLYTQWNPISKGQLYDQMVNYVYEQLEYLELEEGLKPTIRGFFWMQGEADSCSQTQTNNYKANLTRLVSSFREEFEEIYGVEGKGIAFVDAGISDCETWALQEDINRIKKEFADSDPNKNYYFDTMENGLEYDKDNTDYYHFDATSEVKLGKLFISTLLDNGWFE